MALRIPSTVTPNGLFPSQEEDSFLGLAGDFGLDLLASPFRIAEGVYDDTLGALIGDQDRASMFGTNRTIGGDAVQGIGEFLTAFIPGTSVLKAGALGTKALGLTKAAQAARSGRGAVAAAKGTEIARGALAGAFADAAVFDGQEGRLSNLIESNPDLANPITEFLAADENDGEVEGRLKNALEGLLLGGLTEPLFAALKGIKLGSKKVDDVAAFPERQALEARNIGTALADVRRVDETGALTEYREAVADFGDISTPGSTSPESANIATKIAKEFGITEDSVLGPEAQIIQRFVDRVTPAVHDSMRVQFTKRAGEKSSFDLTKRVLTISHESARAGRLAHDTIHEVYHALQDFLPKGIRKDLTATFEAARKEAIEADPDLLNRLEQGAKGNRSVLFAEDYKYLNEDEWFAEVATAKTLKDIEKDIAVSTTEQVGGVIKAGRLLVQEGLDLFRGLWGEAPIQKALKKLREEKLDLQIRDSSGAQVRYTEDFPSQQETFVRQLDESFASVQEIAKDPSNAARLEKLYKKRLLKRNPDMDPAEASAQAQAKAADVAGRAAGGKLRPDEAVDLFGQEVKRILVNNRQGIDAHSDAYHMEVAFGKLMHEKLVKEGNLDQVSLEAMRDEAVDYIAKSLGMSAPDMVSKLSRLTKESENSMKAVQDLTPKLVGIKMVLHMENLDFAESLGKLDVSSASPDELADFYIYMKKKADFVAYSKGFISAWARGLKSLDIEDINAPNLRTRPRGSLDTATPPAKVKPDPQADPAVKRDSTPDGTGQPLQALDQLDEGFDARQRKEILSLFGGEDRLRKFFKKFQEMAGSEGVKLDDLIDAGEEDDLAAFFRRLNKVLEEQANTGVGAMLQDYWYFSLLSAPSTLAVNTFSTGLSTIYQPLEQMLGAALRKGKAAVSGDDLVKQQANEEFYRAFDQIHGLVHFWKDSAKIARRSFKEKRPILSESSVLPEQSAQRSAFSSDNLAKLPRAPQALVAAGDTIGKIVGYPGDVLRSTDEFYKQVNYRAYVYSHLMKEARATATKEGIPLKEAAAGIEEKMELFVSNGSATTKKRLLEVGRARVLQKAPHLRNDPERLSAEVNRWVTTQIEENPEISGLAERALALAEQNTFTAALEPGSLGSRFQGIVNDFPVMKVFVPFIRTPLNIFNAGFARTPFTPTKVGESAMVLADMFDGAPKLGRSGEMKATQGKMAELASSLRNADPEEQARIMGQLAVASTTMAAVMGMAGAGMLTGGGPREPGQRQVLQSRGWQPYSIKIGDTYFSYARLDPIATFVGIAADLHEYLQAAGEDMGHDPGLFGSGGAIDHWAALPLGVMASSFKQVTEKTFMQGISELVQFAENPDRRAGDLVKNFVGAATPNVLKSIRDISAPIWDQDPAIRETRGIMDKLMDKIPGLSLTLPPRRNFLGETTTRFDNAFEPFFFNATGIRYSIVEDDTIKAEMGEIGLGLRPPKAVRDGIDLHQITVGNTTAYDRMLQLRGEVRIKGRTLRQELVRTIRSSEYQRMSPVSTFDTESPRQQALRSIIDRYHRASFSRLLTESPELKELQRQVALKRRASRLGISLQ